MMRKEALQTEAQRNDRIADTIKKVQGTYVEGE